MKIRAGIVLILLGSGIYSIVSGNDSYMRIEPVRIAFPAPEKEDLKRGYVEALNNLEGTQIFILSGDPHSFRWRLYLSTEQPYFNPVQLNKSRHDLLWKLHHESENRYQPVSLHRTEIISGSNVAQVQIDFRLKIGWQDEPAQYILEVMFELEKLKH